MDGGGEGIHGLQHSLSAQVGSSQEMEEADPEPQGGAEGPWAAATHSDQQGLLLAELQSQ